MSDNRIYSYFYIYKLAIEIGESGHKNRNMYYDIKRQKAVEQKFSCEFNRVDPDKENLHCFEAINKIIRRIKQSSN